MEVDRVVYLGKVVVKHSTVTLCFEPFVHFAQKHLIGACLTLTICQPLYQRSALRNPFLRILHILCMEEHQLSRDFAQVAARICVVRDISDTLGIKRSAANSEDLVPRGRRYPRIQAMNYDVIKFS